MKNSVKFWIALILLCVVYGHPSIAQVHDHSTMPIADAQFNPYVVGDNRGGFYFAYIDRKGGQSNVILQHSQTARNLSGGVRVNDRPGDGAVRNENPPKVAIGRNNEVYVVWASERERWKGNIRFARSLNGGRSFERAIDLNSDATAPPISRAFESIVIDPQERIYVAWIDERNKTSNTRGAEIWMAVSEDHGKTFSHDRKIVSDVCECCRTALAVDSDGRVYLSYRTVPASGPMFRDIAVARSDDRGKTFKSHVVNHDGWELNACPIDGATLTIDSRGRIYVIWFTQSGDSPRLYAAASSDRGVTFTKPEVFDPNQKVAKHAHAEAVADNRILIAWDDLNGGSVVKWGVYDLSTRSLKLLGTERQASYPVITKSGNQIGLVALRPEPGGVFRHIEAAGF